MLDTVCGRHADVGQQKIGRHRMAPTDQTGNNDPVIARAVAGVRDRFGADGLRQLIALAQAEITRTENAQRAAFEAADTQAWVAYTDDSR